MVMSLGEIDSWLQFFDITVLKETLKHIPTIGICPIKEDVFKAFSICNSNDCKVVFLGQDPYPQKGVATGILFGNKQDTLEENLSPSLKVIKEAAIDFTISHNYPIEFDNTLEEWAKQGILMINSALTVEINKIGSHTQIWRPFISKFLSKYSHIRLGILYVLFGKQAQSFEPYIDSKYNVVLKENHPAFYARTGQRMSSDIFYKINEYLHNQYNETIQWYKEEM